MSSLLRKGRHLEYRIVRIRKRGNFNARLMNVI